MGASDSCPGDQNDSGWDGDDLTQPLAPRKANFEVRSGWLGHCPSESHIYHKVDIPLPLWAVSELSHPLGDSPFPPVTLVSWLLALVFFHGHL